MSHRGCSTPTKVESHFNALSVRLRWENTICDRGFKTQIPRKFGPDAWYFWYLLLVEALELSLEEFRMSLDITGVASGVGFESPWRRHVDDIDADEDKDVIGLQFSVQIKSFLGKGQCSLAEGRSWKSQLN